MNRITYAGLVAVLLFISGCQTMGPLREGDPSSPEYVKSSPAEVYIDLANAYSRSGQLAYAIDNAQKAVQADRRNPHAHAMLGSLFMRAGDKGKASRHFNEARGLSPQDPYVARLYGGYLCAEGKVAEADKEFMAAATSARNASPWAAYAEAGFCYEKSGNLQMARERLNTAYQSQESKTIIQALARVERKLGNTRTAARLERKLR